MSLSLSHPLKKSGDTSPVTHLIGNRAHENNKL